jgi:hypothetical protein
MRPVTVDGKNNRASGCRSPPFAALTPLRGRPRHPHILDEGLWVPEISRAASSILRLASARRCLAPRASSRHVPAVIRVRCAIAFTSERLTTAVAAVVHRTGVLGITWANGEFAVPVGMPWSLRGRSPSIDIAERPLWRIRRATPSVGPELPSSGYRRLRSTPDAAPLNPTCR